MTPSPTQKYGRCSRFLLQQQTESLPSLRMKGSCRKSESADPGATRFHKSRSSQRFEESCRRSPKGCVPEHFVFAGDWGGASTSQKKHPFRISGSGVFGQRMRDSIKVKSCRRQDRRQADAHRASALKWVRIPTMQKRKATQMGGWRHKW